MLNTKNATLIVQNTANAVSAYCGKLTTLSSIAAAAANTKLVKGPEIPTSAAPNSSYLTLDGLNGTGLAANMGGNLSKISTTGNNTVK